MLGGRASVLYRVVARNVEKGREALFSLLAGVGTIPALVDVRVQPVIETALLVLDPDRLGRAVHAVLVLALEKEDSKARIFALVTIPVVVILAGRDNL